ncbi:tetratricopeptide repeat protein [Pantanalinema rosaneae CENA516]
MSLFQRSIFGGMALLSVTAIAPLATPVQAIGGSPLKPAIATTKTIPWVQAKSHRKAEADRLVQQAITQSEAQNYGGALQTLKLAILIYQEIGDLAGEIEALGNLGDVYAALQSFPKAIESYQKIVAIARSMTNSDLEVKGLIVLGETYRDLENYSQAIKTLEMAVKLASQSHDRSRFAQALNALAAAYFAQENYAKALEIYPQLLRIAREQKDQDLETATLLSIGAAYYNQQQPEPATKFYQQAITLAKTANNQDLEIKAIHYLSDAYWQLGDYPKSIDILQQAATHRFHQHPEVAALFLVEVGQHHEYLGDKTKATEAYRKALAIVEKAGISQGEAYIRDLLDSIDGTPAKFEEQPDYTAL